MKTGNDKTAELGDVLAALYDEAATLSADPKVVTRLATRALADLLDRAPPTPRATPWKSAPKFTGWFD
jgi:hypothetical protein